MKIIAVIPARYKSSRFPGKPLSDIFGKPMIWWVYQHCLQVPEFDEVYVATDDDKIFQNCTELQLKVIMTSENNQTGTDRVGEVAEKIPADIYVNVQGDEPLMEPSVMSAVIRPLIDNQELLVSNCMTVIKNPIDVVNNTIPKLITNEEGIAIYLTRAAAPYPKGSITYNYFKQVCVYGFKPDALKFYRNYGKEKGKSKIESIEDIEILRFIENGYKVQFVEVDSNSVAVDTQKDLDKVRSIFKSLIDSKKIEIINDRLSEN